MAEKRTAWKKYAGQENVKKKLIITRLSLDLYNDRILKLQHNLKKCHCISIRSINRLQYLTLQIQKEQNQGTFSEKLIQTQSKLKLILQ